MRRDILTRGVLRYTLFWGGTTALVGYGCAWVVRFDGGLVALSLLVLGVYSLVHSVTGTTGAGAGILAIEPASGVDINPLDYASKPLGSTNLKIFFWSIGVVLAAILGLALA